MIGKVIERFEDAGLKIVASKMIKLDKEKASGFYAEHEGKPFFEKLVNYMISGPVIVQVICGENAILRIGAYGEYGSIESRPEQFEQILLIQSMLMQFMAQTLRKVQSGKSHIFSKMMSCF